MELDRHLHMQCHAVSGCARVAKVREAAVAMHCNRYRYEPHPCVLAITAANVGQDDVEEKCACRMPCLIEVDQAQAPHAGPQQQVSRVAANTLPWWHDLSAQNEAGSQRNQIGVGLTVPAGYHDQHAARLLKRPHSLQSGASEPR